MDSLSLSLPHRVKILSGSFQLSLVSVLLSLIEALLRVFIGNSVDHNLRLRNFHLHRLLVTRLGLYINQNMGLEIENIDGRISKPCYAMIDWFFQSRHGQKLRYKMYFLDLRWGGQILILESFFIFTYLGRWLDCSD